MFDLYLLKKLNKQKQVQGQFDWCASVFFKRIKCFEDASS